MPLEADFLEWFIHSASIRRRTGEDRYGKKTYAAPAVYPKARVVSERKLVRSPSGEDVMSVVTVWLPEEPEVDPDLDVVEIPGHLDSNGDPILYEVMFAERHPDEAGPHHTKLFLGE